MNDKQQSKDIIDRNLDFQHEPIYQKPKASLFLEKAIDIQSDATNMLES